jgi:hypothetical protein
MIVIVIAGLLVYLALRPSPLARRPTGCVAGPATQGVQLSPSQAAIAAVIAGVANERGMPTRAVAIAYATALQESKLANLHYGTMDSVGVFQQRPSEGWGTAQQIEDPVYAAGRFFAALAQVPHYQRLPIYEAAQDVQHSADGSAYGQYATMGTDMARAFSGALPHAVWCSYGTGVGKPRLAAAKRGLDSDFGRLGGHVNADPLARVAVRDTRQGWAVASWLVAHAATFGITEIRYLTYEWLASSGSGRWRPLKPGPRTPAATTAVVFG